MYSPVLWVWETEVACGALYYCLHWSISGTLSGHETKPWRWQRTIRWIGEFPFFPLLSYHLIYIEYYRGVFVHNVSTSDTQGLFQYTKWSVTAKLDLLIVVTIEMSILTDHFVGLTAHTNTSSLHQLTHIFKCTRRWIDHNFELAFRSLVHYPNQPTLEPPNDWTITGITNICFYSPAATAGSSYSVSRPRILFLGILQESISCTYLLTKNFRVEENGFENENIGSTGE